MPRVITSYRPDKFIASYPVEQLLLLPDQRRVAALANNAFVSCALELFDLATGVRTASLPLPHMPVGQALYPDSGTGGLLYLYRPEEEEYSKLQLMRVDVADGQLTLTETPVVFTTDSSELMVAVAGELAYLALQEAVQVRALADGALLRELPQPLTDDYNVSAVSPDGQLAVFGGWDSHLAQVYRSSNGQRLYELQTRGVGDGCGDHLTFTPDQKQLVTARENVVQFWDLATGALLRTVECDGIEEDTYIMTLALSADGRYLALTHTGPALSVYDLEANEQLWLNEYLVDLDTCCFSPDSEVLLVTSGPRLVRYHTRTGQPVG